MNSSSLKGRERPDLLTPIATTVAAACAAHPGDVAVVDAHGQLTYAQLARAVAALASAMKLRIRV